ncbi:MAG: cytochrome c [Candidatus Krumholzibacteriia bacterium]
MDFPVFHLDFFGNRLLIAVIASVHVLINHMLAVGAMPMITAMEWHGWRRGDQEWDRLAYRLLFIAFVVTTTLGALTGVGIWVSTSLVNPAAIGSLIRIFFWAWFTEWLVFVGEVLLILVYFLTWRSWGARHKRAHIGVGVVLSAFSWATMAIIVAILGFQMETGVWTVDQSFRTAVLNPLYLPQLAFRTPFAMVTAGLFGLMLTWLLTRRRPELRARAVRFLSVWTLAWTPLWLAGSWLYYQAVPEPMRANLGVALGTTRYESVYDSLVWLIAAAVGACLLVATWGALAPRRLPGAALLVPGILSIWLLSYFERAREFVRKPDVIEAYMYSNALRDADYPLYREQGLLRHAAYAAVDRVTEDNRLLAGQEMFRLACSRCHTTRGVNGIVEKLATMYGAGAWDADTVELYLGGMHNARPFMPPLPGNEEERAALAAYLVALRGRWLPLHGAQTEGRPRPAAAP